MSRNGAIVSIVSAARPATPPRGAKQPKHLATSARNIEPVNRFLTSPKELRYMEIGDAPAGSGRRGPQALGVS
jgi:hypothetical protein